MHQVPAPEERLQVLATELAAEHRACEAALQSTLAHAIRAGELLQEAKALVRHGEWLSWLAAHFEGSVRTAQAYMRVATHRAELEAKYAGTAHPSLASALEQLAAGAAVDPAVREFGREVHRFAQSVAEILPRIHHIPAADRDPMANRGFLCQGLAGARAVVVQAEHVLAAMETRLSTTD